MFCEECIWDRWRADDFPYSRFIKSKFNTKFLIEPYISFNVGEEPLCFLLTNPGGGLDFQLKENMRSASSPVSLAESYFTNSVSLGTHYSESLTGAARRRLDGMQSLSKKCRLDGVLQLETIPFHSKSLPSKNSLVGEVEADEFLFDYLEHLRGFLENKNVFILSAVSSQKKIGGDSISKNPWLSFQSKLINFDPETSSFLPLTEKNGEVTSCFLYEKKNSWCKGFILMMGGNHLPNDGALEKIGHLFSFN